MFLPINSKQNWANGQTEEQVNKLERSPGESERTKNRMNELNLRNRMNSLTTEWTALFVSIHKCLKESTFWYFNENVNAHISFRNEWENEVALVHRSLKLTPHRWKQTQGLAKLGNIVAETLFLVMFPG